MINIRSLLLLFCLLNCNRIIAQRKLGFRDAIGDYKVIFASDSVSLQNLNSYKLKGFSASDCNRKMNILITDSSFTFVFDVVAYSEYDIYQKRKGKIKIHNMRVIQPLISSPRVDLIRDYEITFYKLSINCIGIHFKNIKKIEPNYILNYYPVKFKNATPQFYNEYLGDLYIVAIKD